MDTLTITQTIEASGLERKQAEAIAKSITETVNEHHEELATKEFVRAELRAEIAAQTNRLTLTVIAVVGLAVAILKYF